MPKPIIKKKVVFFTNNDLLHKWFSYQVSKSTMNKTKNSGFRLKVYRNILKALDGLTTELTTTEQSLALFRENGMKFTGEEAYYKKHGEWKSSVLNQIDSILINGTLPEITTHSYDPKIAAIQELSNIPEIGTSAATKLYDLGITSIEELISRAKKEPELLNRKQKLGLQHHSDLAKRIPRQEMDQWNILAHQVAKELGICLEIVGSYRRGVGSSGDIDIMISHDDEQSMERLIERFRELGVILDEFVHGKKKFGGVAKIDKVCRKLDIAFYPPHQYPFALLHWTGSGDFNQIIRAFVKKKGMTLCEYGLYRSHDKEMISIPDEISCDVFTEKDIFRYLGIDYVEPCDRTNRISFA